MQYIDARNEEITTEEVIALCKGQAKPYPNSWYSSAKGITTRRNASLWRDYQGCLDLDSESQAEIDWSEFTCPLNHWEYLALPR